MKPITVPGTLASLSLIRDYARAAAAEAGLDKKRTYRLELAVDEIATNIVNHGYQEAGLTGDVVVRATNHRASADDHARRYGRAVRPATSDAPGAD